MSIYKTLYQCDCCGKIMETLSADTTSVKTDNRTNNFHVYIKLHDTYTQDKVLHSCDECRIWALKKTIKHYGEDYDEQISQLKKENARLTAIIEENPEGMYLPQEVETPISPEDPSVKATCKIIDELIVKYPDCIVSYEVKSHFIAIYYKQLPNQIIEDYERLDEHGVFVKLYKV